MCKNNYRKYFYDKTSVYRFCFIECLTYQNVASSIRYILKKNNYSITIDIAVSEAIKIHTKIRNNRIVSKLIEGIKQNVSFMNSDRNLACRKLNVSSKNVCYITKRGYDPRSAIIIIYYASDNVNNKGEKIISSKSFNKIISNYQLYKNNIKKLDIKIAILLYCANINVSRNDIFQLLDDGFISRKALKLSRKYNINPQYVDDIINDLSFDLLKIIDVLLPFEKEQVYKYINLTLQTTLYLSIAKYKSKDLSLDAPIYYNNSSSYRTLKDYIAS
ncbi:MAG: hypothetical protein PHU94_01675 [Bacilli bacterium]|nr:hypothetical protein [Bacilli bacterium]MDD4407352.1 hypothetical protein [Bacilli bacterium]